MSPKFHSAESGVDPITETRWVWLTALHSNSRFIFQHQIFKQCPSAIVCSIFLLKAFTFQTFKMSSIIEMVMRRINISLRFVFLLVSEGHQKEWSKKYSFFCTYKRICGKQQCKNVFFKWNLKVRCNTKQRVHSSYVGNIIFTRSFIVSIYCKFTEMIFSFTIKLLATMYKIR